MPQDEEAAISSIAFPGQTLHQPERSAEIPNHLVLEKSPTSTEVNVDNLPANSATVPQPSQSLAPFRGAQDDDANLQLTVPTPVPRPITHTTLQTKLSEAQSSEEYSVAQLCQERASSYAGLKGTAAVPLAVVEAAVLSKSSANTGTSALVPTSSFTDGERGRSEDCQQHRRGQIISRVRAGMDSLRYATGCVRH